MANFADNASGATWWQNVEPIQVVPLGGQICNLNLVAKFATNASHWVNFWVHCASGNVLFCFEKGPPISIHIGPAVSFTLGWVGDVPGIKHRVRRAKLRTLILCLPNMYFDWKRPRITLFGLVWVQCSSFSTGLHDHTYHMIYLHFLHFSKCLNGSVFWLKLILISFLKKSGNMSM